jgi:hypothetical protein
MFGAIAIGTLTAAVWRRETPPESQDSLRSELRGGTEYQVEAKLGSTPSVLLGRFLRMPMPPAPRHTWLVPDGRVLVYDRITTDPKSGARSSEVYVYLTQERSGQYRVVGVYFSKEEVDKVVPSVPSWFRPRL